MRRHSTGPAGAGTSKELKRHVRCSEDWAARDPEGGREGPWGPWSGERRCCCCCSAGPGGAAEQVSPSTRPSTSPPNQLRTLLCRAAGSWRERTRQSQANAPRRQADEDGKERNGTKGAQILRCCVAELERTVLQLLRRRPPACSRGSSSTGCAAKHEAACSSGGSSSSGRGSGAARSYSCSSAQSTLLALPGGAGGGVKVQRHVRVGEAGRPERVLRPQLHDREGKGAVAVVNDELLALGHGREGSQLLQRGHGSRGVVSVVSFPTQQ